MGLEEICPGEGPDSVGGFPEPARLGVAGNPAAGGVLRANRLFATSASIKCWSQMLQAVISDWSSCAKDSFGDTACTVAISVEFLGSVKVKSKQQRLSYVAYFFP